MMIPNADLAGCRTILDAGGWFKPDSRATHVVDLMPWETRGARLQLDRAADERFNKSTWYQVDFLRPDLRLPFEDGEMDFAICGQTVEDLADPRPLLRELGRVAKRGIIECPSRLAEQTVGVRNRESFRAGHPHHHWIVESHDGRLQLYSKADSRLGRPFAKIPLMRYERIVAREPAAAVVRHRWTTALAFETVSGSECARAAAAFAADLRVAPAERAGDLSLRLARRARSALKGRLREDFSWWTEIVEISRPYSAIELGGR